MSRVAIDTCFSDPTPAVVKRAVRCPRRFRTANGCRRVLSWPLRQPALAAHHHGRDRGSSGLWSSSVTLSQRVSLKRTSGRPGRGIASCRRAIAGAVGRPCLGWERCYSV